MTMTDPIADMLTRIRNAAHVRRKFVDIPSSKIKSGIAKVLADEGFVAGIDPVEDDAGYAQLRLSLKYDEDGQSIISSLKRISKPGCRVYAAASAIPEVRNGLGIAILTTPQGVLSGTQAVKKGIGGEVLCTVY